MCVCFYMNWSKIERFEELHSFRGLVCLPVRLFRFNLLDHNVKVTELRGRKSDNTWGSIRYWFCFSPVLLRGYRMKMMHQVKDWQLSQIICVFMKSMTPESDHWTSFCFSFSLLQGLFCLHDIFVRVKKKALVAPWGQQKKTTFETHTIFVCSCQCFAKAKGVCLLTFLSSLVSQTLVDTYLLIAGKVLTCSQWKDKNGRVLKWHF